MIGLFRFTEDMLRPYYNCEDSQSLADKVDMLNNISQEMLMEGQLLPLVMTDKHAKQLAVCSSMTLAEKTLRYMGEIRSASAGDFIRKRARQYASKAKKAEVKAARANMDHLIYGLGHNTIRIRLYDSHIENHDNWNAVREFMPWGQPLVIDLAFMKNMTFKQAKSMAFREIPHAVAHNRSAIQPFALHFTNFDPECEKCQFLHTGMPNFLHPTSSVLVTEKPYSELFDKKRIVYLTPDSREVLREYDPDDVYVVGAVNDGGHGDTVTLSSAKEAGVRHAKMPLRQTIGFGADLNVDHVVAALLDVKATRGDWFYALRWMPARFFKRAMNSEWGGPQLEAAYWAHSSLSPQNHPELMHLPPRVYRERYGKVVAEFMTKSKPTESERERSLNDLKVKWGSKSSAEKAKRYQKKRHYEEGRMEGTLMMRNKLDELLKNNI